MHLNPVIDNESTIVHHLRYKKVFPEKHLGFGGREPVLEPNFVDKLKVLRSVWHRSSCELATLKRPDRRPPIEFRGVAVDLLVIRKRVCELASLAHVVLIQKVSSLGVILEE